MHSTKALGLFGYVLVLIGIGAIAVWLALAAQDHEAAFWTGIGAILTTVVGIGAIVASRLILTSGRKIHDRTEEDPVQPEVTEEEAAEYEAHYHGGNPHEQRREPTR
jgi:heme/copper-type cytochrome/quinol oxidase subunit 2